MNDGFIAGLLAFTILLIVMVSHSFGRIAVAEDCENYGKSKVGEQMLECRVIKEKEDVRPR